MSETNDRPDLKGRLFRLGTGYWSGSQWVGHSYDSFYSTWKVLSENHGHIENNSIVMHLGVMAHGDWHHIIYNDQVGWAWGRLYDVEDEGAEDGSEG